MKKLGIGIALYLGAVALGLGSTWWVLKKAPWLQSHIRVGAWKGNLLAGTVTLDKKNTEKGKWGILAFGDVSMWKLVDEDAQQAA